MEQESAVLGAVSWAVQLLTGSMATAIAVIAVALVGFSMLQGHLNWRDAIRVVLGCFVLFGSPSIAAGLIESARDSGWASEGEAQLPAPPVIPSQGPQFDPYAGATTPM